MSMLTFPWVLLCEFPSAAIPWRWRLTALSALHTVPSLLVSGRHRCDEEASLGRDVDEVPLQLCRLAAGSVSAHLGIVGTPHEKQEGSIRYSPGRAAFRLSDLTVVMAPGELSTPDCQSHGELSGSLNSPQWLILSQEGHGLWGARVHRGKLHGQNWIKMQTMLMKTKMTFF